jgi:hypothetical protein
MTWNKKWAIFLKVLTGVLVVGSVLAGTLATDRKETTNCDFKTDEIWINNSCFITCGNCKLDPT